MFNLLRSKFCKSSGIIQLNLTESDVWLIDNLVGGSGITVEIQSNNDKEKSNLTHRRAIQQRTDVKKNQNIYIAIFRHLPKLSGSVRKYSVFLPRTFSPSNSKI